MCVDVCVLSLVECWLGRLVDPCGSKWQAHLLCLYTWAYTPLFHLSIYPPIHLLLPSIRCDRHHIHLLTLVYYQFQSGGIRSFLWGHFHQHAGRVQVQYPLLRDKEPTTECGAVHHPSLLLWVHTRKYTHIKQQYRRPHLPYSFGEALQCGDYLFITFSKGKILDRGRKEGKQIYTMKPHNVAYSSSVLEAKKFFLNTLFCQDSWHITFMEQVQRCK